MKKKILLYLYCLFLFIFITSPANAVPFTIDFSYLPAALNGKLIQLDDYDSPDGIFDFSSDMVLISGNPIKNIYLYFTNSTIEVKTKDGNKFDILNFRYGTTDFGKTGGFTRLIGDKGNNDINTLTLKYTHYSFSDGTGIEYISDDTQFSANDFKGLDTLKFEVNNGGGLLLESMSLDYTPVPEPASLFLMGLSLITLAGVTRKKMIK